MKLKPDELKEIERKALAGESLTNPTAEKQYHYETFKNGNQANKPTFDTNQFEMSKPHSYESAYGDQMKDLMNQLMNKQDFSYNAADDPLYNQYKEMYNREGDRAMKNTMSEASALTGGRTNSWAVSAGSQAQDYYSQKLNDKIPELQQLAYSMWQDQNNQKLNQLGMLQGMDQLEYGRWQDGYNRWVDDKKFNYTQYIDSMGLYNNERDFNAQQALNNYQIGYQGERDTISDNRYDSEWANKLTMQDRDQANIDRDYALKKQQINADQAYRNAQLALSKQKASSSAKKSSSSKTKFTDSEFKSRINSMLKESAVTGYDEFGNPIKGNKYNSNDVIEWMVSNGSEQQAEEYMDYFDLSYDEKQAFMKHRGKSGGGSGGNRNTWTNMTK